MPPPTPKGEPLNVAALQASMDNFHPSHKLPGTLIRKAAELQDWLDVRCNDESPPTVNIRLCRYSAAIEINDVCVWDSEIQGDEGLTFAGCIL